MKTIPWPAARPRIGHIREYPPGIITFMLKRGCSTGCSSNSYSFLVIIKIDSKIDFLSLPKVELHKHRSVLLCFSLQLAQEYERGDQSVLGQCQCKGEYLETHGFGTGTWFYLKKCKEG